MDGGLSIGRDETLVDVRREFVLSALSGLSQWESYVEIPKELTMDTFQFRTMGKKDYVERFATLDQLLVTSWAGRSDIDDRALCFAKPQLSVAFGYLKKLN